METYTATNSIKKFFRILSCEHFRKLTNHLFVKTHR